MDARSESREPAADAAGGGRVDSELRELDRSLVVLDLAYFEGLTQPEMAALLAIPLGTVKTRVRDGLIKLRRLQAQQPLLSQGKLPDGSSQKKVLPPLPRAHPPGDQALPALS